MKMRITALTLFTALFLLTTSIFAQQQQQQPKPPAKPRPSLKAGVMQTIGVDTEIKIVYSRPGVKGREIWGKLVPFGMNPGEKYSDNKPYPWRGGANENTTIELSKNVTIDGKPLPAGKYSIHFIPGEKEWVVIFNKTNNGWGSYKYDEKDDALRITVSPVKAPFEEWLKYGFDNLESNSAVAFLHWTELKVPFKIAVAE
jgi:hypothetical protein